MTPKTTAVENHLGQKLFAFYELTKPGVTLLVVLTSAAGFYLGSSTELNLLLFFHTLMGTIVLSGGAATLNEFMERELDGKMNRTRNRPLPSGRLTAREAAVFGGVLVMGGALYLALLTNVMAAVLGIATVAIYLLAYTPLKTRTPICTTIGAIPGAMPPLIGWVVASGRLEFQAWILFGILFAWQFPHFLSIAWIYKDDYRQAGFTMLPSSDVDGRGTGRKIMAFTVVLLILSVMPVTSGLSGMVYLSGALLLGGAFLWYGVATMLRRSAASARNVLLASVVSLPLLLILMVIDKR